MSDGWLQPQTSGPTGGRVIPFRRPAVKPRRKRRSLAALIARPLAGAFLLVGAPVATAGWALTSPRFALTDLAVTGSERVPAAWVRAELSPFVGRNLLRLQLPEVDAALARHPWVAAVELSKKLPRTLSVAVVERRPAVRLDVGGAAWFAQADGRPIAPDAAVPAPVPSGDGLLLVRRAPEAGAGDGGPGAGVPVALAAVAELAAAQADWAAGITEVDTLSEEDVRLHTSALPFPLVARVGRLAPAIDRLEALLPELAARYPALESVDLRFARRIVLRPAAARPEADPEVLQQEAQSSRGGSNG